MKACECEHDSHFGLKPTGHVYKSVLKTYPVLTIKGLYQKCYYCYQHHSPIRRLEKAS